MRVDLRLQHFVAGLLQKQLLFVVFVDQGVDLAQHGIKFPRQGADLIRCRVGGQQGAGGGKIALLLIHGLHGFAQGMDGLCDQTCHVQQYPCKQ